MEPKIRVGIVGATVTVGGSGWGANAHVPALQALPDYELKAICTAHPETARASAEAFGAALAFDRFEDMVASPEIDLAVVCVRVPGHYDLVKKAIDAGKSVFCEWPLGASVAQAEAMSSSAADRSLTTAVGLQARSDPMMVYARELVQQGYVGDVLAANLTNNTQAITRRGNGRIWQGDRRNGANTLTISAGHSIDAMCFILGEFTQVTARLATTIRRWYNTDTGGTMDVDSPDWIGVSGRLSSGAEVSCLVATVPVNPSGYRLEIFGSTGTVTFTSGLPGGGPSQLLGGEKGESPRPLDIPERLGLIDDRVPAGPPRNVARAYTRLAGPLRGQGTFQPDFAHAVKRHQLIEAIERSSAEGRAISL
jgi:predicted dehydrogenase